MGQEIADLGVKREDRPVTAGDGTCAPLEFEPVEEEEIVPV
jgi:hypothetical protein